MQRNASFPCLLFGTIVLIACQSSKDATNEIADSSADTTWAILPFNKVDSVNPVLGPGNLSFLCPILDSRVKWDEKDVFNPAAVVRDGKVHLLFRAEDKIGRFSGTSRIGLAVSEDGFHFSKRPHPVLYPENDSLRIFEWEGGVEDPRVVETEDGTYIMTYTAYDGKVARLLVASSRDLMDWRKHGTVLRGPFQDTWSKSGAIIARREGERVIATRINGRYWMYFGDTDLFMAYSDDLIHWQPLLEQQKLKPVLKPRNGYFDSRLVESGPFALLTGDGIVLIYNGMNADEGGDPNLPRGAYCAGQALFDAEDPSRLIGRLERSFMKPDKDYEIEGQVNQVCFLEGMVPFKGKWFLYYGTADSRIAVAVKEISAAPGL